MHFPIFHTYSYMQKSWLDKLLECIRNRDKQAKKKARSSGSSLQESPTKRQKNLHHLRTNFSEDIQQRFLIHVLMILLV